MFGVGVVPVIENHSLYRRTKNIMAAKIVKIEEGLRFKEEILIYILIIFCSINSGERSILY